MLLELVAGEAEATGFDRLGQATTDCAEGESGHVALRFKRQTSGLARKLKAAVELEASFLEEFGGEADIGGAIHSPEPELLFLALEEVEGVMELLHGAIKGGSQKEDAESPGMSRVLDAETHTVFAGLVTLDAAAIIVADSCGTPISIRGFAHNQILKIAEWTGVS
jgi:hypothetical protein